MSEGVPGDNAASTPKHTVLIVDDMPENLSLLGELLQPHYRVRAANSGGRALAVARSSPRPDLILLDVMMPGVDGYEVLGQLRADASTRDVPVIFVTAMDDSENEERGLALGAVDYITKPINPAIVLARVRTHLELKNARDRLEGQNVWLEAEIARRMSETVLVQNVAIQALACLAEARDNETGAHIIRTQNYVRMLAEHLRDHDAFRAALEGPKIDMIAKAAPLHDLGKVGIPDAILLKPGKLTAEEFEIMKTHAQIGADAIKKAMDQVLDGVAGAAEHAGRAFAFLRAAHEIALGHHEKWDGSGYPQKQAGDDIPVAARLMALADVFDALTTRRVYKPPMSMEQATEIILEGRARHFDPRVVDAFLACREPFAYIAERYADEV
jgi:putative two-component system response regulator